MDKRNGPIEQDGEMLSYGGCAAPRRHHVISSTKRCLSARPVDPFKDTDELAYAAKPSQTPDD